MTILCGDAFHEAARFAISADEALEAALHHAADETARARLTARRGQGARTLLSCFAWRANADALDNEAALKKPDTMFPDGTMAQCDGKTVPVRALRGMPVRDTFIYADLAPHSFFFREIWLLPDTRKPVELLDRCWYALRGAGPEKMDKDRFAEASTEELDELVGHDAGVFRTYSRDVAAQWGPESVVRTMMRRRQGLCGGIIYHADYVDGKPAPYGSWSTHT